jgi:hypothetical protein
MDHKEPAMWERIKIVTSSIWAFVLPFLRQLLTQAGPVLMTSAMTAVKLIADNGLGSSGEQKRDMAFRAIAADLQAKGIEIGVQVTTSMINAAIEVAVQKLKAD